MKPDPREIARWARIVTANRLICVGPDWRNTGIGGNTHGGADFCTPIEQLAAAMSAVHGDQMRADLLTTTPPARQCAIPLLVELCAGTAALSLRLERAGARPPVSRMGAKTGYSDAILALAGLEPGDKAGHYLWCEPDDGVRLLLHAYRDADLAREAARIIRSWADEEPRALWERLRAEGPARCPPVDPREVARWAFVQANRTPHADVWKTVPRAAVACGVEANLSANGLSGRFGLNLPATIHDDATTAPIPDPLPAGSLVFIDPPYIGTTGYAHDLDRPAVVRLAQQWAAAGARVMISEAVPIDALVACGWHAVEITAMRVGQRRTFSKQQREWVTCSFEPDPRAVRACEWAADRAKRAAQALKGGDQIGLFAGGEE